MSLDFNNIHLARLAAICAVAGSSMTAGVMLGRRPSLAFGLAAIVAAVLALRRWSLLMWVVALITALFLYHFEWATPVGSLGSLSIHLSDAVVLILCAVSLCGGISQISNVPGAWAVGSAVGFVAFVLIGVVKSFSLVGVAAAVQARHLMPFILLIALPFSRAFARVSAQQIVTAFAWALIALAGRSIVLVTTGYEARQVVGVERIYQTWEPFLAAALALALWGYVIGSGDHRRLYYAALAASSVPIVFGFFRTVWIVTVIIGFAVFALVRSEQGKARAAAGLATALVLLTLGAVVATPHARQYGSEVSLRASEITPQLDAYRLQEYRAVWQQIEAHLLLGSGFATNYQADWTIYRSWSHNAYEWMWWRIGAIGLTFFLGMLTCALCAGFQAARRLRGSERGLAVGLIAGVLLTAVAANLHENFENFQTNSLIAVMLAELVVLGARAPRSK